MHIYLVNLILNCHKIKFQLIGDTTKLEKLSYFSHILFPACLQNFMTVF